MHGPSAGTNESGRSKIWRGDRYRDYMPITGGSTVIFMQSQDPQWYINAS